MERLELKTLPAAPRMLAAFFLIALGLAYAVALLFVFVKSDMTAAGISAQFRGDPETGVESDVAAGLPGAESAEAEGIPSLKEEWKARHGMRFPKPLKEMILTTHLHMLSISMVLFLVGGIFCFSSFPERAKAPVIALGFVCLATTYSAMWAVRYLGGGFSVVLFLSGLGQSLALGVQMLSSLRDLLHRRGPAETSK